MDWQILFNVSIGVIVLMVGWMWNKLNDKLEKLQNADMQLKDKISEIHVLVAGQYVKNEALDKLSLALFAKLDKIESRLYRLNGDEPQ